MNALKSRSMLLSALFLISVLAPTTTVLAEDSEFIPDCSKKISDDEITIHDSALLENGKTVVVGHGNHGDMFSDNTPLVHSMNWPEPTIGFYALLDAQCGLISVEQADFQFNIPMASTSVTSVHADGDEFVLSMLVDSMTDSSQSSILMDKYTLEEFLEPDSMMESLNIVPFEEENTLSSRIDSTDYATDHCIVIDETDNEAIKMTLTEGWLATLKVTQTADYDDEYFSNYIERASNSMSLGDYLDLEPSGVNHWIYHEDFSDGPFSSHCGIGDVQGELTFPLWGYMDAGVNGYFSLDIDGTESGIANFAFRTLFIDDEGAEVLWFQDDGEDLGNDANDNNEIKAMVELLDITIFDMDLAGLIQNVELGDCTSDATGIGSDHVALFRINSNNEDCSASGIHDQWVEDNQIISILDSDDDEVLISFTEDHEADCMDFVILWNFETGIEGGMCEHWESGVLLGEGEYALSGTFSSYTEFASLCSQDTESKGVSGESDVILAIVASDCSFDVYAHGTNGKDSNSVLAEAGNHVYLGYSVCQQTSQPCTMNTAGSNSDSVSPKSIVLEYIYAPTHAISGAKFASGANIQIHDLKITSQTSSPVVAGADSSGITNLIWWNSDGSFTMTPVEQYHSTLVTEINVENGLGMILDSANFVRIMSWSSDLDGDGQGDFEDPDNDNDGVPDDEDDCPNGMTGWTSNSATDHDGDGCKSIGEDQDDDNDGTPDGDDDFKYDPSEDTDTDGDGQGNNADTDDDNDGWSDEEEMGCNSDPLDATLMPNDHDSDGMCDYSDQDDDNDGTPDNEDQCDPDSSVNSEIGDALLGFDHDSDGCHDDTEDSDDDNDGIPDIIDNCPRGTPGPQFISSLELDMDADGCLDSGEDDDDDGDGVSDLDDNCPRHANTDQADLDGDQIGNVCDDDDDADGVLDVDDGCSGTAFETNWASNEESDIDGDGCRDEGENGGEDPDDDGDGIPDSEDLCPRGATGWTSSPSTDAEPDGCRDEDEQNDVDGDGVYDHRDACPNQAQQWEDVDGDGYCDNVNGPEGDDCPNEGGAHDEMSHEGGIYGCPDSDGDGWADPRGTTPTVDEDHRKDDPLINPATDSDLDGCADDDGNCEAQAGFFAEGGWMWMALGILFLVLISGVGVFVFRGTKTDNQTVYNEAGATFANVRGSKGVTISGRDTMTATQSSINTGAGDQSNEGDWNPLMDD